MIFFLLACMETEQNEEQNEVYSGDCADGDNGARTCYHAPVQTDTYLPDCNNTLAREYWRVFSANEDSAYIIPRPDGMGLSYDLCDDSEVGVLMETYGLCTSTLGADEVEVINNIPPTDALRITHRLHEQLFFSVDENDMITPWIPPNDMIDVCGMSDNNDAQVESFCSMVQEYYGEGECSGIAFFPAPEEAVFIAARANTLYGLDIPAN